MSAQSLEREVRDVAIRQEADERRIGALEKLTAANAERIDALTKRRTDDNAEQLAELMAWSRESQRRMYDNRKRILALLERTRESRRRAG